MSLLPAVYVSARYDSMETIWFQVQIRRGSAISEVAAAGGQRQTKDERTEFTFAGSA